MTATHDHRAKLPASAAEWVTYVDEQAGYPSKEPDIVAQLTAPTGVEVQLVNLSRSDENPDVAVVYARPRVSRGRSPAATMLSPLELFLAFETGERTPGVLVRHHRALARRGIFAAAPRAQIFSPRYSSGSGTAAAALSAVTPLSSSDPSCCEDR